MRYLVLFLLLTSCADRDPLPAGIEGRWQRLIPVHPPATWTIRDGLILQEISAPGGVVVSSVEIPYAQRGDTLILGGDLSTPPRRYIARLIGADVLECTPVATDPDAPALAQMMYFERL